MVYEDDFEDLIAVSDEELAEAKKKRKRESLKATLRALGAILLVILVGVGVFFGVTAYNDHQREQERLAVEAAREEITLQIVNVEQVEWADRTCSVVNSWRYDQFPVYEEETEPFKVKKDMAQSLRDNAVKLRKNADEISMVPFIAHENATEIVDNVTLVDNYRIIGPEQDPGVSHASQSIAASLVDYAQSMDDMARDLDQIADYDFDGMRTGILRVGNFFDLMNDELRDDLSAVLTTDLFDNALTMERVASLEPCNENMISQEMLAQEHGDEIREQKVLENIVVQDRCEALLTNNELIDELPEGIVSATTSPEESTTATEGTDTANPDEPTADPANPDEPTSNEPDQAVDPVEPPADDTATPDGDGVDGNPGSAPAGEAGDTDGAPATDTDTATTTPNADDVEAVPAEGTNSEVLRNIRACENFLTTTVIDPTHPIHDKVIKTVDSETARPDLTVNDKPVEIVEDLSDENATPGNDAPADDATSADTQGPDDAPAPDTNPDN